MKTFFNYVKKYKKILIFALVFAVINQVFSLLDPQIFRLLIDNYVTVAGDLTKDDFIQGVGLLLLALVGVSLISRIAKNFQNYFVNSITQRVGTDLYSNGVKHVFSLPYETFEDRRSGEILRKLQKAKEDSQKIIESSINILFLSLIGMIFVIIYAFFVHYIIALAYLAFIPLISIVTFIISKKIKIAQQGIVQESSRLAGSTTETLRNVELVKSLGLEDQEIKRLNDVNNKILGLELKKVVLLRKLSFYQGTLVNATRAVLMFLMLYLIFNQSITLGEFFTLLFYSFFIFSPLGELSRVVSDYQEARASNEELDKILSLKPIARNQGKKIKKIKKIELKNVSFKYNSSDIASVNNISLNIKMGETVAFVGPSGSGKTTLIKLILGLYNPDKGLVKFNDESSKDINFDALRKKIGFVAQETQLFSGTIKENLLFVNPKATNNDCIRALKMASAESLINRGNKGLNNKIGEGGLKLSGGEKQRLAIARALIRNPDLIIFDEATSSLDSITEKDITNTIKSLRKYNSKIIHLLIAHRLSTISHADTIYVLEKGKIVEKGSHNSLIKKKGLYYRLWKKQNN